MHRFERFVRIVSKNNTNRCRILKCDIKKFFASIDQEILIKILQKRITDENILNLLQEIIYSFKPNGLPLGNLTSQLFANVYLDKLDQFIKHKLNVKYYIRYADDFAIFSEDRKCLENLISQIVQFLERELKLVLHPNKILIKRIKVGMDFLGVINFFGYKILRTKTKNRIFKRIKNNSSRETINSYLGLLKHVNSGKIKKSILNIFVVGFPLLRE